ncbi:MAG: SAVED domain-containing protein [Nitrospira sp.]|nr:SAVED domain-containing protein [Nitrospira sp.]
MSVTNIPEKVKIRLWGKAAGRCEYEGCNEPLWLDSLTKAEFNTAYIAHIIADSPDGPRGDPIYSEQLKAEISNLMLMCDKHHRLIDKEDVAGHTIERLQAMKAAHEQRIEVVSSIDADKKSHILLYGANIGVHTSPLSLSEAALAMSPDRYPADAHPLSIGLKNSSFEDHSVTFWTIEDDHLRNMVIQQVRPRLKANEISHLSVFAIAPQPLLILLGSLLSDIPAAEVYQRHREPSSWKWETKPNDFQFIVSEPNEITGPPVLVFSLSASITNDRLFVRMGKGITVWRVTIPSPHNDFLKSRQQAQAFRQQIRTLMDHIKLRHGENEIIHVFPAMPVCLAVEFGRLLMPKADLPLRIYDENKAKGGFVHALDINLPKRN